MIFKPYFSDTIPKKQQSLKGGDQVEERMKSISALEKSPTKQMPNQTNHTQEYSKAMQQESKTRPSDSKETSEISCQAVTHFALTKIEKTGSSTLFTIFSRFVRENNLNLVVQPRKYHIDWRKPRGKGVYSNDGDSTLFFVD